MAAITDDDHNDEEASRDGSEPAVRTAGAVDRPLPTPDECVERISAAAHVIDSLARRISLLALNARIFAAQAGPPQGRRFAVLAEEIKELTERTGGATNEIEELIGIMRRAAAAKNGRPDEPPAG